MIALPAIRSDEVYTSFLLDYAACEDRIQKKFSQLHDLQNNLVVSSVFHDL